MRRLLYISFVAAWALILPACGGGGGSGGSGAPPVGGPQTIVSGSVQAPSGQVAFHQPTFWDFLESSACASVSGLTFVPDGTTVQIGLIDRTGTLTAPLASTKISGGRYSFNLTNLSMSFSSSFVVQVSNP